MRARERASVRPCVRASVRPCVRASVCVCVCVRARRAILWAAGIEHRDYARERAGFWDRVYGFNMRCIKKARAPWRLRIAFIAAFAEFFTSATTE